MPSARPEEPLLRDAVYECMPEADLGALERAPGLAVLPLPDVVWQAPARDSAPARAGVLTRRRRDRRARGRRERGQDERHDGAVARRFEAQLASVQPRDALDGHEPEAPVSGLGGLQELEQQPGIGRAEAGAPVAYLQQRGAAGRRAGENGRVRAGRRRLDRVAEQMGQRQR
jgi:hypothetical protein